MNHLIFSAGLTSFFTIFLGLFAIARHPRTELSRIFAYYSWSIALWSFCFAWLHLVPGAWAVWWGRVLHLGCTFIPVLFFHFASVLSGAWRRQKAKIITAYGIVSSYNLLNLFPGLFTREIIYRSGYAYPKPMGLIYFSYFLVFVVLVCGGLFLLWRALPCLPRDKAKGVRLFMLVTSLGYLGGMNNFLIMIDLQLFPLFPYGLYAVALYAIVTSHLIRTHHLLDSHSKSPTEQVKSANERIIPDDFPASIIS